jgi:hypothetical protein
MSKISRPAVRQAEEGKHRWRTFSVATMMKVVLAAGCLMFLVVLADRIRPEGEWPRARRMACMNNLKQIALAVENYQAVYHTFPPAYVADATGKPMHSWRVLILPFLDEQGLYDLYDFSEPWDGPNNSKLLGKMPPIFHCPSRNTGKPTSLTSYVVVRGNGTMFPGAKSVRVEQVTDRLSDTIMAAEVANVTIPWTKPDDLDLLTMGLQINDRDNPSISSNHRGGANVARGDATCLFVEESMTAIRLRAHATIAGGETADRDWDW